MASYVEVNPGDAANAANRLLNTSTDLQGDDPPPDPESVGWGEDEFGEWMRGEYLKAVDGGPCLPDRCVEEKHNIGGRCGELGEGIHQAMHDFELQEMVNTHRIETAEVESEDPENGGGSPSGTAPTTTPVSNPAPTTAPPSNPAPADQGAPGEPSTDAVSVTARMYRPLQLPDGQEEPADEPAPGAMVVGRMFRALQPHEEPSADEAEPERHAFMARLLSFPDHSNEPATEDPGESSPEAEADTEAETEAEADTEAETEAEAESEPDPDAEPGRTYRTRWLIDPTATSASVADTGPATSTDSDLVRRSRWMIDPMADPRSGQTVDSSPPE